MVLKLVVFDMDGTLLRPKSSWGLLHDHFGTDNSEMLTRYLRHEVTDAEFVATDLALWAAANGGPVDAAMINAALDGAELLPGAAEAVAGLHAAGIATAIIDRKSTRLNSSHVVISYAVFCLKKKKETTQRPHPPI